MSQTRQIHLHVEIKMQNYEILIKSFLRFLSLGKLVRSIIKYYPDVTVHIADDSVPEEDLNLNIYHQATLRDALAQREHILKLVADCPNIHFHNLPFDTGLSAGRNFLVKQVKAPYFLIMDDDFIITERTDLDKLYRVVFSQDDTVIVGGGVMDYGRNMKLPGELVVRNEKFIRIPYGENAPKVIIEGVECISCRFVSNFFIANTELFKEHNLWWESSIKAGMEHALFFYSIPEELKIYFTRECLIDHFPASNRLYRIYRGDRLKEQAAILKKVCGKIIKWGGGPAKYK